MNNFLRILATNTTKNISKAANNSGLIGPTPYNTTDGSPVPEDDGIGFFTIIWYILIFVFFAALIGGIALFFYWMFKKIETQNLIQARSDNPELLIKHKSVGFMEKNRLEKWKINDTGVDHVAEVEVERVEVQKEVFFKLVYKQPKSQIKTIIANKALEKIHDNVYFEVEIEEIEEGVEIVIGLSDKKTYQSEKLPGSVEKSFGIYSKEGKVWLNGKELYSTNIKGEFGDTFGVGFTFESGRIWIFHNGQFLNDPSIDSINQAKDPYEFKKQQNNKELKAQKKKEIEAKMIKFEPKNEYFPVIGTTGPCKLSMNIGGAMFRCFDKDIANGLL